MLSWGQEIMVRGKVIDEFNDPVADAVILIQNTIIGTVTDANGDYELQFHSSDTLECSAIGYTKAVIPINGQTNINIILMLQTYEPTPKFSLRNFFNKFVDFFNRIFERF